MSARRQAASVLQAAEFEVVDQFTVDGATILKSSVQVIVPDIDLPFSLWVSTSAITPHLYVSTNGNVGIWTATPESKLEINGTSKFNGIINTNNQWISGDGGAEGIYIKDDGNVGIGTQAPESALDVEGTLTISRPDGDKIQIWHDGSYIHLTATHDNALNIPRVTINQGGTLTNLALGIGESNEGDTGLYAPSTDSIGIVTNGTERVRITNTGNVGIGTTSPGYKFDVNGVTRVTANGMAGYGTLNIEATDPFIRIYDTDGTIDKKKWDMRVISNAPERLAFRTINDANTVFTTKMVITNTGNVGIGTTAPDFPLEVADYGIKVGATSGRYELSTSLYNGHWAIATGVYGDTSGDLIFSERRSYGVERMRIKKNGNVGIGTTDPGLALDVDGYIRSLSGYGIRIANSDTDTTNTYLYSDTTEASRSFGIKYTAVGDPVFYINNIGNVGIGTTEPLDILHIVDSSDAVASIKRSSTETGALVGWQFGITPGTTDDVYRAGIIGERRSDGNLDLHLAVAPSGNIDASDAKLTIQPNGNVGIGTTTPLGILDVVGNTSDVVRISSGGVAGQELMVVKNTGNVGIGTTDPGSYKLNVNGDTNIAGALTLSADPTSALHAATKQYVDTATGESGACPTGMAYIPGPYPYCIDKYEAYLAGGTVTNCTCTNGSQAEVDACNSTAVAGSASGQTPLVTINWCAAKKACQLAGKHLLTNSEWFNAANYKGSKWNITAEEATEAMGCNTGSAAANLTGASAGCVTQEGVFDMIGNVWEWVDFVMTADPTNGVGSGYVTGYDFATGIPTSVGASVNAYGNDYHWAYNGGGVARAVRRGGAWDNGAYGGVFAFHALDGPAVPSSVSAGVGFRCGRRR